jgi:hypothetical protein
LIIRQLPLSGTTRLALPVAASATKVSAAAEEQKENDDNQEQFHGSLL